MRSGAIFLAIWITCWTAGLGLPGAAADRSSSSRWLGRVSRGPVLDRKAHGLGQQQAQHAERQAQQARGIQVGLQQRAAGQTQVEQAPDQP